MRSQAATCLFETPRRAEATVFWTRPSLKEHNVDLSFYEVLYASLTLVNKHIYTRRAKPQPVTSSESCSVDRLTPQGDKGEPSLSM